jgi:hypothetical protein
MEDFINNYSEEQKLKIDFKWNGEKDYKKWGDENLEVRREVIEYVLSENIVAPDILIKDLFEIEATFSREAYGAGDILADLGDLLLNQTGSKFVEVYFVGKGQSFDTENTVIPYGVSKEKLESIVKELHCQLQTGSKLENLEYYIGYFEDYIEAKT